MKEEWKDIKDYEGLYQVSNLGNVRSLDRYVNYKNIKERLIKGKEIKPVDAGNGYMRVTLSNKNKTRIYSIHRLVAEAFIPNPENKPEINHKKGRKNDNRASELEWCTHKENMEHACETGLKQSKGKTILQYDLQGNFVKEWDSLTEAGKYTKTNKSHICQVCKKQRNKAGNYIWKYKDAN